MTDADWAAVPEVPALVALAHSGRQAEAHDRLMVLTDDPRPLVAWLAAAAATGFLWWTNRTAAAGELAERTVVRLGPVAEAERLPPIWEFSQSVAAAAQFDGIDPEPRLIRMIAALPPGHDQRSALEGVVARIVAHPSSVLPAPVQEPVQMLTAMEKLARQRRRLTDEQAALLLSEAANCGRRELVVDLVDRGYRVPDQSATLMWTAQILSEAGRPGEVEPLLVRAASAWVPLMAWETLPGQLPLGVLRGFCTPAVRRAHLERPIAVGCD